MSYIFYLRLCVKCVRGVCTRYGIRRHGVERHGDEECVPGAVKDATFSFARASSRLVEKSGDAFGE